MRTLRAFLLSAAILGCALPVPAELANGIRAIVNDTVITYQQVELSAAQAIDLLRRQYGHQPEIFRKKLLETLSDALEQLVQRQLILHEFKSAGYNLPESIIDEAVQERIRERFVGDRARLIKTLQSEGMTYEAYRQQVREQIIVEALSMRNIASEIIISPHKIESYYAENRDQFRREDQVKLRMIVLDGAAAGSPEGRKKLAEEIVAKINEGAPFAEMAAVYSTGSQRREGGAWGWVDKSVFRKELAQVAFSLDASQHSGVIETPEACYIMLVEEKQISHIKPLNEVRAEIEKTLQLQERERLRKQWIDRLRSKTFIRYF